MRFAFVYFEAAGLFLIFAARALAYVAHFHDRPSPFSLTLEIVGGLLAVIGAIVYYVFREGDPRRR